MNQSERRQYLIRSLLNENLAYRDWGVPQGADDQKRLLRGLMNVRPAQNTNAEFLNIQDEYLREVAREKGVTDADSLSPVQPGIYLWQGDITTLRCDAIVNAANSGMTGCYVPNHRCIDNAIHTFAGVQLRLVCEKIMQKQGYPEPTGRAKITPAFNLPCRYVIHTVGPIIADSPTKRDCELLASCYQSCLELAAENSLESVAFCCISTGEFHFPNEQAAEISLESVAFCCISTGEFHFPNEQAAEIAVRTVKSFLHQSTSVKKVIFNVFKDTDREIYARLLRNA